MKISDICTILSCVASVASALSAPYLELVFPGHGTYIAGVLTVSGLAAGAIVRTLTNKTGAPATAIPANAPIVPAGTKVVTNETPVLATNISSTSEVFVKQTQP